MQPAEEHIKGTVVITEADSAPCDPVGVVKEDEGEGSSCEAEARELSGSSDQSQDEDQTRGLEEKVVAMAEEMIQKWQLLKEVFRIPKRTPQVSRVCVYVHGGIIVDCSMATCTCVSINSCTVFISVSLSSRRPVQTPPRGRSLRTIAQKELNWMMKMSSQEETLTLGEALSLN